MVARDKLIALCECRKKRKTFGLFQEAIRLLERINVVENYSEVARRIGYFTEPAEIKIHSNEELLKKLKVLFVFVVKMVVLLAEVKKDVWLKKGHFKQLKLILLEM